MTDGQINLAQGAKKRKAMKKMATAPSQPFQCWRIQIDSQLATAFSREQFFSFGASLRSVLCLVKFSHCQLYDMALFSLSH